jgi:hypothetical protein
MVDRQIVYIGAIPQDTDQLQQNKNTMIGLGYLIQALLGTSTVVDGLACTPNSPAAMNVLVGPGSIYSLAEVDATAYGSLNADTSDQIVKQGIIMTTQTFSTPAPSTSGQSVVYLIEAAYQDIDGGSTVLPYYNASNPSVAWSGPNNTGISQNTVRKGVCTVQIKTGVAATTGTQTTPSPDAGFTGLYAITVANGQTTVTSGNIQQLSTAPFITTKLPAVPAAIQAGTPSYAADSSVSANTITVALSPIPASLTNGMSVRVKVANTNTGATVMNINGLGNVSVVTPNGSALNSSALVANGVYTFVYDANGTRWQLQGVTTATSNYFTAGTTTGGPNAQVLASLSPASGFSLSNNGQTIGFTAGFTNTGSTTLAITSPSISATTIQKDGGSGLTNLTGGEIVAGNNYFVTVNSTSGVFVLEAGIPSSLFLMASNNLSDVASPSTSLANLGGQILTTVLHVEEQQASGTAGGTFTSGSWQVRALNTTVLNTISGASLSADTITLPAGTYDINAYGVANQVNSHMIRFQNTTSSSTVFFGSSGVANTGTTDNTYSLITGRFTLSGTTTLQLQHQCQNSSSGNGLGFAAGFSGANETYSSVFIEKVA